MIYIPSEDSFLLGEVLRKNCTGLKVLDVGCGSGFLMEVALSSGADSVKGIDVNPESVLFCLAKGLDVIESDLFSKLENEKSHKSINSKNSKEIENVTDIFDLIVFNPPYLPADSREDLDSSLITSGGEKGNELTVRFLENVKEYLNKEGKILLVVSSLTPLEEIEKNLRTLNLRKKVVASKKFFMERLEVWEIRKY